VGDAPQSPSAFESGESIDNAEMFPMCSRIKMQNSMAMIHIIGTCHKTQVLSDLVRKKALGAVPKQKITAFQEFLTNTARALRVAVIGEEMSEDRIFAYGHNAVSVAQLVAKKLQIAHVFCEPDKSARRELGLRAGEEMAHHVAEIAKRTNRDVIEVHSEEVRKQFPMREAFWLSCLEPHANNPILFICGADHCETFLQRCTGSGVDAQVYCPDWTLTAEVPCPCCL